LNYNEIIEFLYDLENAEKVILKEKNIEYQKSSLEQVTYINRTI